MKTVIEPFRIRMIEPLKKTTREERERYISEAGYNPFLLRSEHVLIDLVTDSGTSALSTAQWSAMLGADESFTGSRSFFRFRERAQALFGHKHVIPCHQGRAAEHLLARAIVKPGDVVFANTHFATTRANIEEAGAEGRDLPIAEALDLQSPFPFKGNINVDALDRGIREVGAERVPFVIITVTDNSRGGQPVSMANLQAAREVCATYSVPIFFDAARFAENAYLIKVREAGWSGKTPRDIAREMFALTDGVFMSLKKDGLGNSGGVISLNDDSWAEKVRARLLINEGIPTAGGLAGRDLESLATALDEMLDEDYLEYRIASTERLGTLMVEAGLPVLQPFGAHAVYIDGRAFCPHLTNEQFPAWSLTVAFYIHAGIRTWEVGNVMQGRVDPVTGERSWPNLDLMRLAVPRRVYTQSQLDFAAEAMIELFARRYEVRGLKPVYLPPVLPQFVATFEPV